MLELFSSGSLQLSRLSVLVLFEERWARYEYQYGDLEAVQKLEKRIAEVIRLVCTQAAWIKTRN